MPKKKALRPDQIAASRMRELRGPVSQAQLARHLGELGWSVQQSTIAKIERGERPLSLTETFILAHALSVPPAFLILPPDDEELVEIAPGAVYRAGEVRSWLAGEWYLEGQDPERFLDSLPEGWLDEDAASIAWETVLAVKRAGIEEELRRLKEQERAAKRGKKR
jgi:transcriptional regulator with XRE-family HTH domain